MKMSILELIEKGESKTAEFKETLPGGDTIAKTVIAFSNTAGGKIIIGVDDKRQIVGIPDSKLFELQDKIVSIIYDRCYPNILPEIYTITVDNKILLVIEVFRSSLIPYYLKNKGKNNGTYVRIGATNRLANRENILELERQRNYISYDEEINYDVGFEGLCAWV